MQNPDPEEQKGLIVDEMPTLKGKLDDAEVAKLLDKPKRKRAKKVEPYHLAKVTHTEIEPNGQKVTGVHYIDGIRPSDPQPLPAVKYHLPSLRSGPVKGHPRGMKLAFEDGKPMVQRFPAGPYDGQNTRTSRRNFMRAVKRVVRQHQRAQRWNLAA